MTAAAPAGEEAGAVAADGPGPVAGGVGEGGRVVVLVRPGSWELEEVVLVVGPAGPVGSAEVVVEVEVSGSSPPVPAGGSVVVVVVEGSAVVVTVVGESAVAVVVVVVESAVVVVVVESAVVVVVVESGSGWVVPVESGEVDVVAVPPVVTGSSVTAKAGAGTHTTVRKTVTRVRARRR